MVSNNKSWKIKTKITIDFGSKENANIFLRSYEPEKDSVTSKRSEIQINTNDNYIIFDVFGKDINATRASLNSILNFSNVVLKTVEFSEKSDKTSDK